MTNPVQQRLGARFYLLFSAYLVSDTGTWIYRLTLPLFVLHLTGSALQTAALYALEYGPFLLLSLPGGALADSFERKKLLVFGDMTAGLIALTLAVLVSAGITVLTVVYAVAFLLACVEPVYYPAFQAMLPDIVPEQTLARANSLFQSVDNILSLAGPVIAGTLVGLLGYEAAIYIDAGSFIGSALIISLIRGIAPRSAPARIRRSEVLKNIREGLNYTIRVNRTLLAGSLLFTGTNFGIWFIQANLIYYLTTYLKLAPTLVGVVYGAQGTGAVVGAIIAPWVINRLGNGRTIVYSTIAAGLFTLLLLVFRDIAGVCAVFAVVFALGSMNVVSWFTFRQRIVPPEMLGRVVAATRMMAYASIPIAALAAGGLEQLVHNMYLLIFIGALIRLAAGVAGARTSLMHKQPRKEAESIPEPA